MNGRDGAPGTRTVAGILVVAGSLGLLHGLAAVPPGGAYSGIPAPLVALDSPIIQIAFDVSSMIWMGAVSLPPVIALWGVRRASGTDRHRLVLIAVACLLPGWTIAVCLGFIPILLSSSPETAADVLVVAFAILFPVAGAALILADSATDGWLQRRSPGFLVTAFSIAIGGIALG